MWQLVNTPIDKALVRHPKINTGQVNYRAEKCSFKKSIKKFIKTVTSVFYDDKYIFTNTKTSLY